MALDIVSVGLVCADVMVRPVDELPKRGTLALVPHLEIHVGGLAGVTAIVYSQLGGKAGFVGRLGQDGFSTYLRECLTNASVDIDKVQSVEGMGTASTVVVVSEDGERTFLHHTGAAGDLTDTDIDFDYVKQAKLLHWGGPAVTPGLDGEPIGRVLKRAKELGLKTSVDTCADGSGVWRPRIEHAMPHLDVVMTSLEEAQSYFEKPTAEEIAEKCLSYGVEVVMVKLGPEGLFVRNADEVHRLQAHKVTPVDTTGAGDAACAGFLYGYVNGWNLFESARLANAVGGLTVQAMGGAEAIESFDQVQAFMESG
jgi:sugar/nucleoside kinase (ribokinase family)